MITDSGNPLTLSALNGLVRSVVEEGLPLRYWVTGELSEVRATSVGHCYIELVERDELTGEMVAKARGTIWSRVYSLLRPYFLEQTGREFSVGLKVLLQVTVKFHELYGFSLDVCDIEPAYTIGDMARQRMLIVKRLTDEGVIDLNKELPFPLLPKRVAVVSSASAAGYGDFCDQLNNNMYGFRFAVSLFAAPMQGNKVEEGIIAALDAIASDAIPWDVVVIIRGGGATSDLSCFDTYDLANNCAQFPIPIITGIGHQRDDTLLDIVAHTRVKTPTAAAEVLIHTMLVQADRVASLQQAISEAATRTLTDERHRLQSLLHRLPSAATLLLQQQRHRLDIYEERLKAYSPDNILAQGYTLTLSGGRIIKSAAELYEGDTIVTRFADGETISEIIDTKVKEYDE
ncbi:MAG: exodeoxyribonuclease VII large subunit [Bacteroidaceae bacterium]|nr:exodeoxyribonuclease VII large subunit [Bacteroidaceae bacterium]